MRTIQEITLSGAYIEHECSVAWKTDFTGNIIVKGIYFKGIIDDEYGHALIFGRFNDDARQKMCFIKIYLSDHDHINRIPTRSLIYFFNESDGCNFKGYYGDTQPVYHDAFSVKISFLSTEEKSLDDDEFQFPGYSIREDFWGRWRTEDIKNEFPYLFNEEKLKEKLEKLINWKLGG